MTTTSNLKTSASLNSPRHSNSLNVDNSCIDWSRQTHWLSDFDGSVGRMNDYEATL